MNRETQFAVSLVIVFTMALYSRKTRCLTVETVIRFKLAPLLNVV